MSGDGNYIAAIRDHSGRLSQYTLSLYNRTTNQIEIITDRIKYGSGGIGLPVSLSDDGRYVAFSTALPLNQADRDDQDDVYVYDRELGQFELVSQAGAGGFVLAGITADGSSVGFYGTGPSGDIFIHDRSSGNDQRLAYGIGAILSKNGKYVAFYAGTDARVLSVSSKQIKSVGTNSRPVAISNNATVVLTTDRQLVAYDNNEKHDIYMKEVVFD